jgi:hypothetical protein
MATVEDDAVLADAIIASVDSPRELVRRVTAFYRDLDRADRASRPQLYFHLGLVCGALQRALDALANNVGYDDEMLQ